jgi:hypothetical protein
MQETLSLELTRSLEQIAKLSRDLTEHSGSTQALKRFNCNMLMPCVYAM